MFDSRTVAVSDLLWARSMSRNGGNGRI